MTETHTVTEEKMARFVSVQHALHPEHVGTILRTPLAAPTAPQEQEESADGNTNNYENVWGIAWAEATLVEESSTSPPRPVSSSGSDTEDIPEQVGATSTGVPQVANESSLTSPDAYVASLRNEAPYHHGYIIDTIIGLYIAVFAVLLGTWLFELHALMVYLAAVLCHRLGSICGIVLIFKLLVWILLMVDHLLLFLSVFVVEILAWVAFLLTSLSGGCRLGNEWRLYIRKLSILARWVVRDVHRNWEPKRVFPFCPIRTKENGSRVTRRGRVEMTSNPSADVQETAEITSNSPAAVQATAAPSRPEPALVIWE